MEKKFRYRIDVDKYLYLFLSIMLICAEINTLTRKIDWANVKMQVIFRNLLLFILGLSMFLSVTVYGFYLRYKKNVCTTSGTAYQGEIVGKIRVGMLSSNGYRLVIAYEGGEIVTPIVKSLVIYRIASKTCTVYVYNNMVYVGDFHICRKVEKSINISTVKKRKR